MTQPAHRLTAHNGRKGLLEMQKWLTRTIPCLCLMTSLNGYGSAINQPTAGNGIRLDCPSRPNMVVSWSSHQLVTMKWQGHFQIASGMRKTRTDNGAAYWVTSFRNGDDLVYVPASGAYILFDKQSQEYPEHCQVTGHLTYTAEPLPRYPRTLATDVS